MSWVKSIFSFLGKTLDVLKLYFKEKNTARVQDRKIQAADEKFKNIAKDAISKKDIKKIRDFLSE